jgi:predicted amidophosphoribosyltransferase
MMRTERICEACRKQFLDDESSPFLTCLECRKPLPAVPGGCARWESVYETPKPVEKIAAA